VNVSGVLFFPTQLVKKQNNLAKTRMPDCRFYAVVEINDIHSHILLKAVCLFDLNL